MTSLRVATRVLILGGTLGLAACSDEFDWDLRSGSGLNTAEAARAATTADRPRPDDRGVISYPSYQVVVARRGDTVASIAARLGLEPGELARVNALTPDTALNAGEVLALPRRVAEPSPATGAATTGPITPGTVEVTTLAAAAIDRAEGSAAPAPAAAAPRTSGTEPVRHRVARGETAFSIARTYGVSARALAEWNGLPADMAVREGQTLLIPVTLEDRAQAAASVPPLPEPPGAGSATPVPPSAAEPLPEENPPTPAEAAAARPPSPDLGDQRTAASAAVLAMPADGRVIRGYKAGSNNGIDIGAAAGSPVRAAADGTVAAITTDTGQVPIVVLRHDDGLLTVYANVDAIRVAKGARVSRGQTLGSVRAGDPAFLHFEVFKGADAVDPMPYLQ